jgi:hypothetical protein
MPISQKFSAFVFAHRRHGWPPANLINPRNSSQAIGGHTLGSEPQVATGDREFSIGTIGVKPQISERNQT